MMNIGVGEKNFMFECFLSQELVFEVMSSSSSSSSSSPNIAQVQPRRGVVFPPSPPRQDEVKNGEEEKKHADVRVQPPGEPEYSSESDSNEIDQNKPIDDSENNKGLSPNYSPCSSEKDDDCEIIASNVLSDEEEEMIAQAKAANPSPPEGVPPPPAGAAPESRDKPPALEKPKKRNHNLERVGDEVEVWYKQGLAHLRGRPDTQWFRVDPTKKIPCNNCLDPRSKFLITFREEDMHMCSKTCVLFGMLARFDESEVDDSVSRAEVQKLCDLIMKRQGGLNGRYKLSHPNKIPIKLAKELLAQGKSYVKRLEEFKEKPATSQEEIRDHKIAQEALRKLLMQHYQQFNQDGEMIGNEKYTEELKNFNTARLESLQRLKIIAKAQKENKERLARALKDATPILQNIRGKYKDTIAPIMTDMMDKIKSLREIERKLEEAQDEVTAKKKELTTTYKDDRLSFAVEYSKLADILDVIHDTAIADTQIAIDASQSAGTMHANERRVLKALEEADILSEGEKSTFKKLKENFREVESDRSRR